MRLRQHCGRLQVDAGIVLTDLFQDSHVATSVVATARAVRALEADAGATLTDDMDGTYLSA